jgi:hypothetical protein
LLMHTAAHSQYRRSRCHRRLAATCEPDATHTSNTESHNGWSAIPRTDCSNSSW